MALTKASVVVQNNITMTAAAGNVTSADQDLTGAYQTIARIRFTNGATGPTVAAQVQVQISEDTTAANYMTFATVNGGTVNNGITEFTIVLPDAAEHVQFVSGSNTAQNVTLRIVIEKVTAV